MKSVKVRFNNNKQYVRFYIAHDPVNYVRVNKCLAYYMPNEGRRKRRGLFGIISLSRVTPELVAHEVAHMIEDWWMCRKGNAMTPKNEERRVSELGLVVDRFMKRYERMTRKRMSK